MITFNEHSKTAIVVERSLHQSFFKDWGLEPSDVYSTPMSPTNLAYTTYLTAMAYSKPFHELLGALLPCYWLYWEVGKELEKRGSTKELYQRWIATYSSEEYGEICEAVLSIADTIGNGLAEGDRAKVTGHFVTTSRYEYMFWDSAYRLEEWPV
jgi:thiaminase/transcriptional activator TenA